MPIWCEGGVPKHTEEPHERAAKFSSLYIIYFCYNRVKLPIPAMCARWNVEIVGLQSGCRAGSHKFRANVKKQSVRGKIVCFLEL